MHIIVVILTSNSRMSHQLYIHENSMGQKAKEASPQSRSSQTLSKIITVRLHFTSSSSFAIDAHMSIITAHRFPSLTRPLGLH